MDSFKQRPWLNPDHLFTIFHSIPGLNSPSRSASKTSTYDPIGRSSEVARVIVAHWQRLVEAIIIFGTCIFEVQPWKLASSRHSILICHILCRYCLPAFSHDTARWFFAMDLTSGFPYFFKTFEIIPINMGDRAGPLALKYVCHNAHTFFILLLENQRC